MSSSIDLQNGWQLQLDHSPEWLFARLTCDSARPAAEPRLAEVVVEQAQAGGLRRIVFELDARVMLISYLVGQLVALHKRFLIEGGMFRICGFSTANYDVLQMLRLADRLPNFADRESAVMGRL